MDIGKMRHRITLLKPIVSAENTLGEYTLDYKPYKTVWANVSPTTGREYSEAQKIRAETTDKITLRYLSGINTDMKIKFEDKEFNIVSVLNIGGRNCELQIVAAEVDKNGKERY